VAKTRYADYAELLDYCRRSADPVGRLLLHLFGAATPENLRQSDAVCSALQLINHWQDVGVDAAKPVPRIYLPQDEMARFGVSEADILQGRESDAFRALMAFQAERARGYYAKAMEQLPAADRKSQRAGLMMAAIYRTLLEEIARDGYPVLRAHISLPPARKLWLAFKTWITA